MCLISHNIHLLVVWLWWWKQATIKQSCIMYFEWCINNYYYLSVIFPIKPINLNNSLVPLLFHFSTKKNTHTDQKPHDITGLWTLQLFYYFNFFYISVFVTLCMFWLSPLNWTELGLGVSTVITMMSIVQVLTEQIMANFQKLNSCLSFHLHNNDLITKRKF